MTTISKEQTLTTLINVFEVEPKNQQKLIDILVKATEETMSKFPGFISANIHRSLDGTRVVNYAQWRRREDLENAVQSPEAQPHIQETYRIIKRVEPYLYEVAFVDEAQSHFKTKGFK